MSGGASAGNDPLSPNTTPPPNQNSNREALRLETLATQTKQRTDRHSNREKEASSFGPHRGGSFSPPAFRPRRSINLYRRQHKRTSNRESLRLETPANYTKQTTQHRSNREVEALSQAPTCSPFSSHQNAIYCARRLPAIPKNTTRFPSFLLRLKAIPTVYFLRVTESFNRTMLRLRRTSIEPIFRQSAPFSRAPKPRRNEAHVLRTSNRDAKLFGSMYFTQLLPKVELPLYSF